MIRKILILIFVSILLAGCITSQPAEKGTLQLTSSPTGAEIYLDNQYRGSTPSIISDVVPGNHTLEFRMKGYRSWKSAVMVVPGTTQYFGALSAQPGSELGTDNGPAETTAAPAHVSVDVDRDQMTIGDSVTFSGTATGTGNVILMLFGPGYYKNGIVLDKVRPDAANTWSYTWNPGSKVQSGTFTIIVYDAEKTVSDRVSFRVIGNGVVSVYPSSYAVGKGEPVVLSGQCTTGASYVRVVLSGPERYSGGVDLGNFPVTAENTWSFRYTTDLSMPAGIYSVYVSDVPQTTTGSTQFTLGYAS
jgi:PEGA domain